MPKESQINEYSDQREFHASPIEVCNTWKSWLLVSTSYSLLSMNMALPMGDLEHD